MPNNMEVFQTPKGVLFFIDSAINRVSCPRSICSRALYGFCNSDWTDDILTLVVRDD